MVSDTRCAFVNVGMHAVVSGAASLKKPMAHAGAEACPRASGRLAGASQGLTGVPAGWLGPLMAGLALWGGRGGGGGGGGKGEGKNFLICESIGHQSLWERCPKETLWYMVWYI